MTERYIRLKYAKIILQLDAGCEEILSNIADMFDIDESSETDVINDSGDIFEQGLCISREHGVYICRTASGDSLFTDIAEVRYWLMSEIGNCILRTIPENECILHASGIVSGQNAVLYSGISGSGKTTLSVAATDLGGYLGDEYIHYNFQSGTAYGDNYPVHMKSGNGYLSRMSECRCIETYDGTTGIRGYAFNCRELTHTHLKSGAEHPGYSVRALIYTQYLKTEVETSLDKMPLSDLPKLILQGIIGHEPPSLILADFMSSLSAHNIPVMRLTYHDTEEAIRMIREWIGF